MGMLEVMGSYFIPGNTLNLDTQE